MGGKDKTKKELMQELESLRARTEEFEKRASEREGRFQSLFDGMTEGFALHEIICDPDGEPIDYRFLEINPAFERITGLERDAVIDKTVKEVLPDIEPFWIETYGTVALTGKPVRFDNYSVTLERHFEVFAYRPAPGQFAVLFTDITRRKQTDEAILRAKKEWEATFDAVPDLIAILDKGHGIVRTNKAMADRLGMTPEQCVGQFCYKAIHGLDHPPDFCPHVLTIKDKREHRAEVHEPHLNGDFMVSTTPLLDERGELIGTIHVARDITERKKAEQALRERDEDLNRAQAVAQTGSWRLDIQKNKLLWSDETYRMFGIRKGTPLTYEAFLATVHPDDRTHVDKKWNAALSGEPYDIEHRIVAGDGIKWVRERAELEFDRDGKLLGGFGTVQDITERKRDQEKLMQLIAELQEAHEELQVAEEELRHQNDELAATREIAETDRARYQDLFDTAPDGYLVTDLYGAVREANVAAEDMLNTPRPMLRGKPLVRYIDEEQRREFMSRLAEFKKSGTFKAWELRMRPRDRDAFQAEITLARAPGPSDADASIRWLIRDISERKKAEEALRHSEEDLNRAQAVAHTGSWRLDVRKNELLWSDENHRIFGIPKGTSMTYETFLSAVHPDDREYVDTKWNAGLRGEPYDIEHRIVADGRIKWVRERAELEFDKDGTLLGGFGTTQDITQRKQAEEELRKSEERFRRLSENLQETVKQKTDELMQAERLAAIGQMVSTVAHEVRNPLQNIQMGIDFLRKRIGPNREHLELLEETEYGVKTLNELVSELLEYAKPLKLQYSMTPLEKIVSHALRISSTQLGNIDTRIELEQKKLEIPVDDAKITSVLANIISNAADAMPAGGMLTIRSRSWEENGKRFLKMSITDTGHGIDEENLDKIFQPFFTTKNRGVGLGLAACQKIVTSHKGNLEIRSQVGIGTTAELTLPMDKRQI